MTQSLTSFGAELRRLRLAAGLTLVQFSERIHYSKGYLSKIETGRQRPHVALARQCDAVLAADGRLAALVPAAGRSIRRSGDGPLGEPDRRTVLVAGAASLIGVGLGVSIGQGRPPWQATAVEAGRTLLDQTRRFGQVTVPASILPGLVAQANSLQAMAMHASGADRTALLLLTSRYAEYAGWMFQEAGDLPGARWWTDHAAEFAAAAGDGDFGPHALVRRALIALYAGDATATIALARRAQENRTASDRVRGLAALREAQGHALAGSEASCRRSIDRARRLSEVAERSSPDGLGPTSLADPVAITTAWCLVDLGRPEDAAPILDQEVARIEPRALRSKTRYGLRQALAYASAGDADQACSLTTALWPGVCSVGSATFGGDLVALGRTLGRWREKPAVREVLPMITDALQSTHA